MPDNENFGAIIFDRPESLDRGWYCLGEGEPGRLPDDGAAGLPAGPVWLTSLSFSEAAEMGLSSSPRFLNSAYLREPVQKLLARLGVPEDDAREQARLASVLFSRVMNVCRALSGRPDFLPARFLKGGLRVLMDPSPDPCVLKEDAERLDNALSYSHRCLAPARDPPPRSGSLSPRFLSGTQRLFWKHPFRTAVSGPFPQIPCPRAALTGPLSAPGSMP